MSKVIIKSDAFRRPVVIEAVPGTDDNYTVGMLSFYPVRFQAESLPIAIVKGLELASQLKRDHGYVRQKRGPKRLSAVQDGNANSNAPAVHRTDGARVEMPGIAELSKPAGKLPGRSESSKSKPELITG